MNTNISIEHAYIEVLRAKGIANPIEYLQSVIDEHMEDIALSNIADNAYLEYLKNPNDTITLEELKRELNL